MNQALTLPFRCPNFYNYFIPQALSRSLNRPQRRPRFQLTSATEKDPFQAAPFDCTFRASDTEIISCRLAAFPEMDPTFSAIRDALSQHETAREKIKQCREAADVQIRLAQKAIADMLIEDDLTAVAEKALEELKATGPLISEIEKALPEEPGSFFRYYDIWNYLLQSCATIAVLIVFIKENTLATRETVVEMTGASIRIPVESYLVGVCNVMPELSRLSMNRVIKSDYETPRRCASFANHISEGFKQLNLRNDFLRKRYDGIKYDVKRLEEIMYDLSIRGLVKKDNPDAKMPDTTDGSK